MIVSIPDFQDLNSCLKSGEVRAVDAVRAYQWAALKANSRLNCVCQFIREAEEWAEACDAMPLEDRSNFIISLNLAQLGTKCGQLDLRFVHNVSFPSTQCN